MSASWTKYGRWRTFLHRQGVERLAMVVASSIGADLAMAFLTQTKLPVEHAFFDGGQFAQIGKGDAPHHDAVSVFRHQEPVLVEGRYAEKDHCGVTTIP